MIMNRRENIQRTSTFLGLNIHRWEPVVNVHPFMQLNSSIEYRRFLERLSLIDYVFTEIDEWDYNN